MPRNKTQFKVVIECDEDGFFVASVADKDQEYRKRIDNFSCEPSFVGVEVITV